MDWGTPTPTIRYRGSSPTHQTSGLSGYPAVDIMAPPGTPIVAPEDGYVYRLSGRDPRQGVVSGSVFGLSLYFKGRSGADYYMTHMGGYAGGVRGVTSARPVRVRKGDPLGVVGDWPGDRGRSHLHMGVQGANAAQIASTPQTPRTGVGGSGGEWWKKIPDVGDLPMVPDVPWVTQDPIESAGTVLTNPFGSVKGTWQAIKSPIDAIRWVGGNWDRVLEVSAGFILVLVGLLLLGRSLGLGTLGRKTPLGRVAGAAAAVDPVERAYARGEEDYLRAEARRAGRKAAESRAGKYDPATADIPY